MRKCEKVWKVMKRQTDDATTQTMELLIEVMTRDLSLGRGGYAYRPIQMAA